jgi:hypothetical protein
VAAWLVGGKDVALALAEAVADVVADSTSGWIAVGLAARVGVGVTELQAVSNSTVASINGQMVFLWRLSRSLVSRVSRLPADTNTASKIRPNTVSPSHSVGFNISIDSTRRPTRERQIGEGLSTD